MEEIIVLDKESNVFSKIQLTKTENTRVFTLSDDFSQSKLKIKIIDSNNSILITDENGKKFTFDFETIVNLQVMLSHLNDFKNQNIFSKTYLVNL
jgi:hypothetical protein